MKVKEFVFRAVGYRRYERVRLPGFGGYVDTPQRVAQHMADDEAPDEYEVETVWLTQAQFNALPEFQGW